MAIEHGKGKAQARLSLSDIFSAHDEFGLLDVQAKRAGANAPLEVSGFEAISDFVDRHARSPRLGGDLTEKTLARRLVTLQADARLLSLLTPYDRHGLLAARLAPAPPVPSTEAPAEPSAYNEPHDHVVLAEQATSLDDIFASTAFDDIDFGDESIFDIKHVPVIGDRESPDEVAQRTPCHDFHEFEHTFRDVHAKLASRVYKTIRFQQASQVDEGDLFIMEGVLCLIDKIGDHRIDGGGRYDPRLRVIYENGTESNHLLQSLAKRLFADDTGRRIVRDSASVEDAFNNISHRDKRAGQIYFVTTLSDNPTLKAIPQLIKIGYTEQTVEDRTKNAIRDVAFLEAPVKILASVECFNLNPVKFEGLIHGFLYAQRLKVTLASKDGRSYRPREWFSVSLDTAMEVVRRIIDGTIVQYRMDNTSVRLVKKRSS